MPRHHHPNPNPNPNPNTNPKEAEREVDNDVDDGGQNKEQGHGKEMVETEEARAETEDEDEEQKQKATVHGEELRGARVSVRWEVQDAVWEWFPGTVTDVYQEEYGRNKGVVRFQVCYDADNSKEWSELNTMVCGEVRDEEAEWSLLAVSDLRRRRGRHAQVADVTASDAVSTADPENSNARKKMRVSAGDDDVVEEEVEDMSMHSLIVALTLTLTLAPTLTPTLTLNLTLTAMLT